MFTAINLDGHDIMWKMINERKEEDRFIFEIALRDVNGVDYVQCMEEMEYDQIDSKRVEIEEWKDVVDRILVGGEDLKDRGKVTVGRWTLRGDMILGYRVSLIWKVYEGD